MSVQLSIVACMAPGIWMQRDVRVQGCSRITQTYSYIQNESSIGASANFCSLERKTQNPKSCSSPGCQTISISQLLVVDPPVGGLALPGCPGVPHMRVMGIMGQIAHQNYTRWANPSAVCKSCDVALSVDGSFPMSQAESQKAQRNNPKQFSYRSTLYMVAVLAVGSV